MFADEVEFKERLDSDRGRMLFFRDKSFPDAPFIEVVGEPSENITTDDRYSLSASTNVWGVSFVASDLQKMRDLIGHENISEVRAAVQPGRSICTLKMSTLGTRVAVMTPHVTQASRM